MPKKTLADTLAARDTNCAHPMCCKSRKLDIQALIDRLGRDHGSMHDDLVGLFICSNCKAAGRDRRQVFFTTKASSGRAIATGSQLSNERAESGRRHLGGRWGRLPCRAPA
ncbi:hypothetical protein [Mesorhizobium sp.]|uniref:hypothetical protein n=1 Tax=Mesorhizobium sp. TaxID=1871066 RepID=UPI000FEAA8CE|nr:hypothetical protein [Mesorhizobium sp.]RWO58751.1 MAG: hypothetical protein EOS14_18835 [Mesorhizobium sp.]